MGDVETYIGDSAHSIRSRRRRVVHSRRAHQPGENKHHTVQGGGVRFFISALYLGAGFTLSEHVYANTPAFGDYVSESYAVDFEGLPDTKPDDGSIPVVWKENEVVHSGTANIMDGKLSIKETNGDYLGVAD